MSRTFKRTVLIGLSLIVLVLAAGVADAGTQVSSSGFQPATSADAPYISRDFAFSGGALYNNDSASGTTHSVTASQGVWSTPPSGNGSVGFEFYGNGNGNTVTCSVYGIGILSGSVYTGASSSGTSSAVGIWTISTSINLSSVHESVFVNAKCDIPRATVGGAYSVLWGMQ